MVGMPALVGALQRIGATPTAIVSAGEPVVTLALAAVLLAERLTALQLVGGALVVIAALVAVPRRDVPEHA
jgi:drug/metabolite transporter (DMT)-like permease